MVCPCRNLTLPEKDNLPTPLLPPPDAQLVFVYPEELEPASGPPQGWSEAGGAGCVNSPLRLSPMAATPCQPASHLCIQHGEFAHVNGLIQFQWQLSLLTCSGPKESPAQ